MMNHFAHAVDALDAAVFSGDGLLDPENRVLFKRMMERWQRQLVVWEEIAAEVALAEMNDGRRHGH
jgi:hypothetical protein